MRFRPKLSVRGVMVLVAAVALMFGIGVMAFSAREARARTMCANQLRSISLGILNYQSAYGSFPPSTVIRPGLPPEKRLSWCVVLSTFIDQWFWDLDWNEPWDSPANRVTRGHGVEEPSRTCAHCRVFECPRSSLRDEYHMPGWTSYVGITGVGTDSARLPGNHPRAGIFGYGRITEPADVSDGLSQTVMIVETSEDLGPWTAGGSSTLRSVDPRTHPYLGPGRPFGGLHQAGALVVMADGSVRLVPDSTNAHVFEAMATISGGEHFPSPGTTP